jgi:hypothetical protein
MLRNAVRRSCQVGVEFQWNSTQEFSRIPGIPENSFFESPGRTSHVPEISIRSGVDLILNSPVSFLLLLGYHLALFAAGEQVKKLLHSWHWFEIITVAFL